MKKILLLLLFALPVRAQNWSTVYSRALILAADSGLYFPDANLLTIYQDTNTTGPISWTVTGKQGASNTFLRNDGSGHLSWTATDTSRTIFGNYIALEFLSGTIDGSNTSFAIANTPAPDANGNPAVVLSLNNGLLIRGIDYTISGTSVSMNYAPQTGDYLTTAYFISLASGYVAGETPSGTINGSNTSFALAHTPVVDADGNPATVLYLNNGLLIRGIDYNISGSSLSLAYAPQTGDYVKAFYFK